MTQAISAFWVVKKLELIRKLVVRLMVLLVDRFS